MAAAAPSPRARIDREVRRRVARHLVYTRAPGENTRARVAIWSARVAVAPAALMREVRRAERAR